MKTVISDKERTSFPMWTFYHMYSAVNGRKSEAAHGLHYFSAYSLGSCRDFRGKKRFENGKLSTPKI